MEENQLLNSFLSDVKIGQKRTTLLLTSFSIGLVILGSSVLLYSSRQVRKKLDHLNYLEHRLQETQQQLKSTEAALREATNLKGSVVQLGFLNVKTVAIKNPQAYSILEKILQSEGTRWRLNGKSVEEGFDSPGYAAYILNEVGTTRIDLSQAETVSIKFKLLDALQPERLYAPLQSGDLIVYQNGYAMFYFTFDVKDQNDFVIGMTPLGVTALEKDFAPIEHIRRTF